MTELIEAHTITPPKVLLWFKLYCGLMCLIYVACALFSLTFFTMSEEFHDMEATVAIIFGTGLLGLCLALLVCCFLPFVLKPRPWVWIYNLIIICLGLTSACFLPICIPLLIFWIKPETRAFFGRN